MLSLPRPVKIFWSVAPVDMRKSFDSSSALVAEHLGQDSLSGHLFVFTSRRRDRVKLLSSRKSGSRSGTSGWRRSIVDHHLPSISCSTHASESVAL